MYSTNGHVATEAGAPAKRCRAVVRQFGEGLTDYACAGKIVDLQRATSDGFAKGSFTVEGVDAYRGKELQIEFQNENLIARMDGSIVACVPDLICCLESEGASAEPENALLSVFS